MAQAKYTKWLSFMADPDTEAQVKRIADAEDRSLSAVLRRLVAKALKTERVK